MTDLQALAAYSDRRDPHAFRQLVEQYQRMVFSAASRRLAHSHDIEEVVQLTFLKLARAAGSVQRDLASWLYATASCWPRACSFPSEVATIGSHLTRSA